MAQESIRAHLRAALEEIVADEMSQFRQILDDLDAELAGRVRMMTPVLKALSSLQEEIGDVSGLEFSFAPRGHMASVKVSAGASRKSLSISTSAGNSEFQVRDTTVYSYSSESDERLHRLSSVDEVLIVILNAVGSHIASRKVLEERRG